MIRAITFPGVFVHKFGQELFCRWKRVAIFDVQYFKMLHHEPADHPTTHSFITMGPFFLSSLLGILVAAPGALALFNFRAGNAFDYFLAWLGVSLAMHAFPSKEDGELLYKSALQASPVIKFFKLPLSSFIYFGSLGGSLWMDIIYAFALVLLFPNLIILMM